MKPNQLEQIIKELHVEAYIWARQCCNFQDWLAKDVLQQVYLKILENKAKFNGDSSLKTWLFSVIRYTAMENIKKELRVYPLEDGAEVRFDEDVKPEINHEKLIRQLPDKQREVLLLVFYHGLTLEKASKVMGVHLGTARTHYDRAKKNLKQLILKIKANEQSG
ncbi:sigma-70 family RNA polymerase sigma factor [Cecembia sp.]|uniref:RNA polymerase sigma factor n=1 Tax=Cecembia sp. TaxID=1898110 RepID=UPI0025BAA5C9|nr:sigma-70 family RNA polymerase sigma factor [Cecembia sp.]